LCSTNGPDPVRVGGVTDDIRARFCDLRLRPESCISYSRLGGLRANVKCDVLWS